MDLRKVSIPFLGAANNSSFTDTPQGTNPPDRILNFELYDSSTDRPRGGSRRGLVYQSPQTLGGGNPIQGMATVVRAPISIAGNLRDIGDGTSMSGGTLVGNSWVLDSVPSMDRSFFLNTTGTGAPLAQNVYGVAWHPGGEYFAVLGNYNDTSTGAQEWAIQCVKASDGNVKWTAAGTGYVNSFCFSEFSMFVFGQNATDCAWKVNFADGATSPMRGQVFQWAQECVRGKVWTDPATGTRYLFVAFNGTRGVGRGYVGTFPPTSDRMIDSGTPASHFRSGVGKMKLLGDATGEVFPEVQYGTAKAASYTYFEAFHGYFRVSEQSITAPHGCLITDMDVNAAGEVFVSRANQGWGFNNSWRPTGATRPYVSCFKINTDGTLAWESDTNSLRGDGSGDGAYPGNPHYNDILAPTLTTVCADDAGDCYVGGRRNDGGFCVFKLAGADGAVLWAQDIMGGSLRVMDRASATDPSDGFPVFVGDRSTAWPGSGGTLNAHWWKLDPSTGDVVKTFDLNKAVRAESVGFSPAGKCVYGTRYVT